MKRPCLIFTHRGMYTKAFHSTTENIKSIRMKLFSNCFSPNMRQAVKLSSIQRPLLTWPGKNALALVLLLLSFIGNAQTPDANGIVYVKPTATGSGNGSSWANATANLKGAIAAAGVTKVYVASGYYHVGSPPSSFSMKNGVEIYGGFNPVNDETDWTTRFLPNKRTGDIQINPASEMPGSVLSAAPLVGQSPPSVIANSGLNNSAVLDGFTVIGGGDFVANGGGIYNSNSSPTLRNLLITSN